ncbi:MAG: multidrug efflux RND transporter permease subunit [Gammaproteobacteria bacterium]|nr:multidrug efflux RND transporter permease subunit [Gammaproteobacteria bacterium]
MKFTDFFIDRPIFAAVLSIVTVLIGALAAFTLAIERHPPIVPPTIIVATSYPGADARTVSETVATPIEQQVNGVENMLYMSSQSSNDGGMQLTITFALETDLDTAQVLVQNRVALAEPNLPEEVRRQGITVRKSSPDLSIIVNLVSPDGRYDSVYMSNYALINLRDRLTRLEGVGDLFVFGARDYSMRIWLDPELLAARALTPGDVVAAIREQNVQVAAGVLGQPPTTADVDLQLTVRTQGRLLEAEEFGDIIVRRGETGQLTRVRDVARIELASANYLSNVYLSGAPTVGLAFFQRPGTNSLATKYAVYAAMAELARDFPPGLEYHIHYDTTVFVEESVRSVAKVLIEATGIVLLVVLAFLQNWRATLIPMLAVPVSLIGTFAVLALLGFSLNTISLMAMVLAIGIVVDDAIVVVENVERNLAAGLARREATRLAMREVASPVITTAIVLTAVFVPTAFLAGITGEFYRQFAVTIAASTVLSALNSLTLSPALAALLLQAPDEPRDAFQRFVNLVLGWFFRGFDACFGALRRGYTGAVARLVRISVVVLLVYGVLLVLTGQGFRAVPSGFLPNEDQGFVFAFIQRPDAAALERTDAVVRRVGEMTRAMPGVRATVEIAGWSLVTRSSQSNVGTVFATLDPFDERTDPARTSHAISAEIQAKVAAIQDAFVAVFEPPPVRGLGNVGGFKLEVQDRRDRGLQALQAATQELIDRGNRDPRLTDMFTTFRGNVPQIYLDIDRQQSRQMGVPLGGLFETLSVYLGSLYVNDFNRFGRTYRVTAQADADFRAHADAIGQLKTRNADGEMVPIGSVVDVREITGPDRVVRYNLFPAAEVNGSPAAGVSTGDALAAVAALAREALPPGFGFEWTELSYQQIQAGDTSLFVFPLCVLFVFLALAAQYESWSLPLSVILIVPMCLLSAITGLRLAGLENNVLTQVGFIVLIGLACKNAILIVQFAKMKQEEGIARREAVVEAARLRLRPILMTSFAFIFGVLPLVTSTGAGAESRYAIGIAVISGMAGVTVFGLLFTPVFYSVIRRLVERRAR